ncbi:alkaline phosphatase [Govanella unica]|uniref:Alkaline phosphatase n=1 Tax=Govanella unica TaxID=2975056 RepID=A0A9X3TW48_9PROT|nr:alkaline phosphatase [Govania unica]MDA5192820.1 alkaline phosphatase [Govania unica]
MVTRFVLPAFILAFALSCGTAQADEPDVWFAAGTATVKARLAVKPNTRKAKNIILFIGDGMGVTTVTAGRIFDGQSRGGQGEENALSFENFPHTALVKTYNSNQQVPDSAGTASAMNTGVKTRAGVLGITAAAHRANCSEALANSVPTFAERAATQGKAIGVVTTTRITHATPAAVYAHSADREWEGADDLPPDALQQGCKSIAQQLIEFSPGPGIAVALGGGRGKFDASLLSSWRSRFPDGRLIADRTALAALDPAKAGHVLGLFNKSHMAYMQDRTAQTTEPTLSEMTAKAIEILSHTKQGYFLMVEGGRIDQAHHEGVAGKALLEVQEFSKAIQTAFDKVDLKDTLILVTADHSHSFTMAGYPTRGNPILGLVTENDEHGDPLDVPALALDGQPFTTLGYYNGPGAVTGPRPAPSTAANAKQQALIPTADHFANATNSAETHGGEDVPLYAAGPWSHLADGVIEQNVIYHIMSHAYGWRTP